MTAQTPHESLLRQVSDRLGRTPSTTDHLMLTRLRVLSMCQYLLGEPSTLLERAIVSALRSFADHGADAVTERALDAAALAIKQSDGRSESVLPVISASKRRAVTERLNEVALDAQSAIQAGLRVVGSVRARMHSHEGVSLPGIRHRFDLVAAMLENADGAESIRARAAAAILYIDEVNDEISDTLGVIGLVDDDFALRVVLEEQLGANQAVLHWSERIASLWDDLPFLQGVNLQRHDAPIPVTWLDRVNSYVSYSHVLGVEKAPLVLLQPSVACSPLHAIVSLIGLLVLDAVTNAESKAQTLRVGQTYEIDGYFARFEGIAGPPTPGWLKLRWSDSTLYQPPALADRMVAVEPTRLSSGRKFSSRIRSAATDPMQRFFDWDAEIGPASIASRLILVASRQRALDLLEGVQSNGVRLLDHGLVRFIGANPEVVDTHGTLILVVPSLSTARLLLDHGVRMQAILIDGYERLHRGRHELPFLINRKGAPPILNWSSTGYYPAEPPAWLPPHKRLEVSSSDLASILELDDSGADLARASLWEAATGTAVRARHIELPRSETLVIEAIDEYSRAIRDSDDLPEYWKYHLASLARTLRLLVTSTPAEWTEVRGFAASWSSSMDEKWAALRGSARTRLTPIRDTEKQVLKRLSEVPERFNSRAIELAKLLAEEKLAEDWYFVCERSEQVKVAGTFLRSQGARNIEAALLQDVAVCKHCVIAGWVSSSFARRLWAHTPRSVVALVDSAERHKWNRAADAQRQSAGQSMLGAVAGASAGEITGVISLSDVRAELESDAQNENVIAAESQPCVFVWVAGEEEAKVLARDSRVVVEDGDVIRERPAVQLRPDDRVILGAGTSRWSPAEEFTGAVVAAVEASHPTLVAQAREWRRALRQIRDERRLPTTELKRRFAMLGVSRELQTIDGWLDVDRASPIAPRGMRAELSAIWPVLQDRAMYSFDEVANACERLRALRTASGRALVQLWRGKTVDFGIDQASIGDLVDRIRQEVHVYEVEAVTLGDVPAAMFGWWVPSTVATHFESSDLVADDSESENAD